MKHRKRSLTLVLSSLVLASAAAWAATVNVVQDGGFESGTPNALWDEASTNFGTPLCTTAGCGFGAGSGPRSGNWWAWFGGIGAFEQGSMSQDVQIPAGPATLSFWLEVPVTTGNPNDFMAVLIDETEIFRVTGDAASAYSEGYAQVTLDLAAFADGGTHSLTFNSTVNGPTITNFFVDDVSLDVEETTCASEGYTGTKLTWCQNICEKGYTGNTLDMWLRRWIGRFHDMPYCTLEEEQPQQQPPA